MIQSLAFIILLGLFSALLCRILHIPRIIGMLCCGILLGPCVFNVLDDSILLISADLRQIALIIILLKAGLSFDIADLKKVGRPALMMSFVPAVFEIIAFAVFAPPLLGINLLEAITMGTVISAVSPAVVIPRMVTLMEEKYGTQKGIPQMIVAGSSCDDIFVIVLFSSCIAMLQGEGLNFMSFMNIPISIVLGVLLGIGGGFLLCTLFEYAYMGGHCIRNSAKMVIIMGMSFLFMAMETWLEDIVAVSGLLAVVSMACVLNKKCDPFVSKRLSEKAGKLWIVAEIVLFVLVGAAVDIRYTIKAGLWAAVVILAALLVRSLGVLVCLIKTNLNRKERLYCMIAYIPKATVQAAIGSVALSLGLACGNIILSVAVLSIIITAPLGAFLMDMSYRKLLQQEK